MIVINEFAQKQIQQHGLLTGGYKQLGKFRQKELSHNELVMFNHILLKLDNNRYGSILDYLVDREDFDGQSGEYAKQILGDFCNSNNNSYYILKLIAAANYMNLHKVASEKKHASDVRSFIRTCLECDFLLLCATQSFNAIYQDMISEAEYVDKKIFISNISVFSNQYTKAVEHLFAASVSLMGMVQKLSYNRVVSELETLKIESPKLQSVIDYLLQGEEKLTSIDSKINNISYSIRVEKENAEDLYAKLPKIAEIVTDRASTAGILPNWKLSKRSLEDKLRKILKSENIIPLKVNKRTEYWRLQDICEKLVAFNSNSLTRQEWLGELEPIGTPKKDLKIRQ